MTTPAPRTWRLIGTDSRPYDSDRPGTVGGHRRSRVYGRLDCRAARRALSRGGYRFERVFFADEATAVAAGYRPCAVCLPEQYQQWRTRATAPAPGSRKPERTGTMRRHPCPNGRLNSAPDRDPAVLGGSPRAADASEVSATPSAADVGFGGPWPNGSTGRQQGTRRRSWSRPHRTPSTKS